MNTSASPHSPSVSPSPKIPWYRTAIAKRAAMTVVIYLFGPMIWRARHKQVRIAEPGKWEAERRWANANGSALLSLLWYVPILILHSQLAAFWSFLFTRGAVLLHLPFLAWMGAASLWPPLPSNLLLRWLLALPLTGLLTMLLEMVQPRTTWQTPRIITREEQQELDAKALAQEKKKTNSAQQPNSTQKKTPASTRKRTPRAPAKPKDEQSPHIPKVDSLWGTIDWKTVPESHPLKQAVRQEFDALRREEARNQWLAQQQATLSSNAPPPLSPPKIVDSTLSSPPAPKDDEYNWDEGEGSIKD